MIIMWCCICISLKKLVKNSLSKKIFVNKNMEHKISGLNKTLKMLRRVIVLIHIATTDKIDSSDNIYNEIRVIRYILQSCKV